MFDSQSVTLTGGQFAVLIVSAMLLLLVMYFFVRQVLRRSRFHRRHDWLDRRALANQWAKIESLFSEGNELACKLVILEADKFLEQALKLMALPGTSLGERLKSGAHRYPGLEAAWDGHKIRNRLVHEANYHPSRGDTQRALASFRSGLKALGIL